MSPRKPSRHWWAESSRNVRLGAIGGLVLLAGLSSVSYLIWTSPGATATVEAIAQQVEKLDPRIVSLRAENAALEQKIDGLRAEVSKRDQALRAKYTPGPDTPKTPPVQDDANGRTAPKTTPSVKTPKPAPAAPSAPAPAPITAPPMSELVNSPQRFMGMYTEQAPFNWATYDDISSKLAVSPSVVGYFGGWDEPFRANAVTRAWEKGRLPLLTWESRPINAPNSVITEPDYSLPRIIGDPTNGVPGAFDDYLHQYARDVVATGLPMAIRLDHEMNGVWYPWAETTGSGAPINGNSPGDYVKMWRHVHDIFEQEGAGDLVIWIWAPNIVNNLPASHQPVDYLATLYPGDDYVDWVGLSGYLRPAYKPDNDFTFSYSFDRSLNQLRAIAPDKPILLAEVGASETGGHKVAWVNSMFDALAKPENSDVIGMVWFNLAVSTFTEGELGTNDWRMDSRPDTLAAFRQGLVRPELRFDISP